MFGFYFLLLNGLSSHLPEAFTQGSLLQCYAETKPLAVGISAEGKEQEQP